MYLDIRRHTHISHKMFALSRCRNKPLPSKYFKYVPLLHTRPRILPKVLLHPIYAKLRLIHHNTPLKFRKHFCPNHKKR